MRLHIFTANKNKRQKSSKLTFLSVLLFIFTVANAGGIPSASMAANAEDDGSSPKGLGPQAMRAGEDISGKLIARYLVTFMKSRTTDPLRTATVVTVTNEASQPCQLTVDWIRGFEAIPVSTTSLRLEAGFTGDFCSREIPAPLTTCNVTSDPELTFDEGRAVVSSSVDVGCQRIAVSARVYYTRGDDDSDILAISDPKIVPFSKGNRID